MSGTAWRDAKGRFVKGHPGFNRKPNSGSFVKGQIPWNKGRYKLAKIKDKILQSWDEGESVTKIMKKYGASQPAVEKILRAYGRELGRKYGAWNKGIYEIHPDLSPSEDLGFILGALQGDGYCIARNTTYHVALAVKDKEFAEAFRDALQNIGMNPSLGYKSEGSYQAIGYGREFINWYLSLDLDKIKEIVSSTDEAKIGFIRGLFDSEGTTNLERQNIFFVNSNKKLVDCFCELCGDLGFSFNVSQRGKNIGQIGNKTFQRKRIYEAYLCLGTYKKGEKEKACKDFLNLIKPSIPRKGVQQ